ncbi:hypothetical protein OC834_008018 [Tilletia horrida]|nr:hypothetical protein OC834_008018 [Tilletia horrida]
MPPEYSEQSTQRSIARPTEGIDSEAVLNGASDAIPSSAPRQHDETDGPDDQSTVAGSSSARPCDSSHQPGPMVPCSNGNMTKRSSDLIRATLKFSLNGLGEHVRIRDVTNETKTEEDDVVTFPNGVVRTEHRITTEVLRIVHEKKLGSSNPR